MASALNRSWESTRSALSRVNETTRQLIWFRRIDCCVASAERGSQQQAAGLEETSASLEEITAAAKNKRTTHRRPINWRVRRAKRR